MKLMDKMIKSKFGLSTFKILGAPNTLVGIDGVDAGTPQAFRVRDTRKLNGQPGESSESFSKFNEIEEIYVRNNEDAKDLIFKINGVVAINVGMANEQYEAIRVNYDDLSLDLNTLIKIYSFTSGDKAVFAKDDGQKNKISQILKSMNISIDVVDLVSFE